MKLFRSLLVACPALLIATLAGAQTGYPDKLTATEFCIYVGESLE